MLAENEAQFKDDPDFAQEEEEVKFQANLSGKRASQQVTENAFLEDEDLQDTKVALEYVKIQIDSLDIDPALSSSLHFQDSFQIALMVQRKQSSLNQNKGPKEKEFEVYHDQILQRDKNVIQKDAIDSGDYVDNYFKYAPQPLYNYIDLQQDPSAISRAFRKLDAERPLIYFGDRTDPTMHVAESGAGST